MRSLATWVAAAVVVGALAGCAQPAAVNNLNGSGATGLAGTLAGAGLESYWEVTLTGMQPGETVTALYPLDENLYCYTSNNRVFALESGTGLLRWVYELGGGHEKVFRPSHVRKMSLSERVPGVANIIDHKPAGGVATFDAVLFNSMTSVAVVNLASGREMRRIGFSFGGSSAGVSDGNCFYVGGTDGLLHTLDLDTALEMWRLSTGNIISAPVECRGGVIFVGSQDGTFRSTRNGLAPRFEWTKTLSGSVTAAFSVDARGCFVPCEDRRIYSFKLDGNPLWDGPYACAGILRKSVQVSELSLFQRAENDKLYALNLANGRLRWTLDSGLYVLAVMNGNAYVQDLQGNLLVVDELTGSVKSTLALDGLDVTALNTTAPAMWAGSVNGRVICIRPASAGPLTSEAMREGAKK